MGWWGLSATGEGGQGRTNILYLTDRLTRGRGGRFPVEALLLRGQADIVQERGDIGVVFVQAALKRIHVASRKDAGDERCLSGPRRPDNPDDRCPHRLLERREKARARK